MRSNHRHHRLCFASLVVAAAASAASAQVAPFVGGTATITNGPNWFKFVDPQRVSDRDGGFAFEGLSSDGTTVFGYGRFNGDETYKYVWDHTAGSFADAAEIVATGFGGAISGDGDALYFAAGSTLTFSRWTAAGGLQAIAKPAGSAWATAYGASEDGRLVAGQAYFGSGTGHQAFLLDRQTGQYTMIGAAGMGNGALAITPDGGTVVGNATNPATGFQQAFRYTAQDGIEFLADDSGSPLLGAQAVSADGSRVAVTSGVWSEGGLQTLPSFTVDPKYLAEPPAPSSFLTQTFADLPLYAITEDGAWIAIGSGDDQPGAIWHEVLGTLYVYEFLDLAGLDVTPTIHDAAPKFPWAISIRGFALDGDILTMAGRIGADSGVGGFVAQVDITTIPGIPEPATAGLLMALGGAAVLRRRR